MQAMNRFGKNICGRTLLVFLIVTTVMVLRWRATDVTHKVEQVHMYGFVLTLEYTGQLVAGLRALLSQQCWISSFGLPLVIVEPFSNNSLLQHSHHMWREYSHSSPIVRFRDLFDLDHFNEQSRITGNTIMATWEKFVHVAPRKIVFVTIEDIHHPGCLLFKGEMCETEKQKEPYRNSFEGCHISDNVVQMLSYLKKQNFYVVRNVCINCMETMINLTPDVVTDHIFGPHNAQDVTLIFNKWRFSMKLTKDCREMETCNNEKVVLPQRFVKSKRLERDANWYRDSYFHSQIVFSIMIRVEWHFITHRKDQNNNAIECLSEVLNTVNELQNDYGNPHIPFFLSMDVGTYGSGSFQHTIQHTNTSISMYTDVLNHTRLFVKELYRNTWTFNDWEESFLTIPGLLTDKGYIATLQRTIASRGDCLILMGGGHFQHMALQTYLSLHPTPKEQCVKYVCVAPAFQRLFQTV